MISTKTTHGEYCTCDVGKCSSPDIECYECAKYLSIYEEYQEREDDEDLIHKYQGLYDKF
jgi:hypothetical protein